MKVVHLSMSERRGGAALAAFRLHQALQRAGVDSVFLSWQAPRPAPSAQVIEAPTFDLQNDAHTELIERTYGQRKRSPLSNTYFSMALRGQDLSRHPAILAADLIHLHWLGPAQTAGDIQALLALGKPLLWTLHDMAPFTGACHFSAGCTGFQTDCKNCPQLRDDPFDLPAVLLQDKLQTLDAAALSWLAPSRWMAGQARASALLRQAGAIHHVPNGVDTECFRPRPKAEARAALGLPVQSVFLLCGADQAEEKRKGFARLARLLAELLPQPALAALPLQLLWVGRAPPDPALAQLPFLHLGPVQQQETMALVYAASDVFVLPSQEDNLPNMLLEALSCGTPVLAFDAGGIGELLQDGVQGRLVALGDEAGFLQALLGLLSDPVGRAAMGERAARDMRENHSSSAWAARHQRLYQTLLQAPQRPAVPAQATGPGPALQALRPALTLHCLEQQQHELALALRDSERSTLLQARLIEAQRAELQAKQALIEQLHDHWQRAEATCAERLALIERLGLRARLSRGLRPLTGWLAPALRTTRRLIDKPGRQIRLDHWWYAKLPPLLAVATLCLLQSGSDFSNAAAQLLLTGFVIACVAAYGHVLNDWFDIASDRLAHKPNTMERLGPAQRALVCALPLALAAGAATAAGFSGWAWLWLGLNCVWPSIYSVPGLRLKERGLAGVACDAAGSHLTPTLLVLTVFSDTAQRQDSRFLLFAATALGCALVLGLKGILNHQLRDRANDLASGTRTFATEARAGRIERFLPWFNAGIELPCHLLLVVLVWPDCPLAALAFLAYCVAEELKHLMGFEFALDANPRNIRPSFPFVNDFFHEIWLPMAACLQLAWRDPHWLWLPGLFVLLFARTFRVQAQDDRALLGALHAHRHPEFWRQKLLRAWSQLKG